jgi:hypothetical protein
MAAPKYQPATTHEVNQVAGPRPATQVLSDVIVLHYLARGAKSGGIYNRRRVRLGSAWSLHAAGRALDVMVPAKAGVATAAGKQLGDEIWLRAIAAAEACGICEVIWWDKRWTGDKGVHPYKPTNHRDHVHIGQTVDMAVRRDQGLSRWFKHFLFER